MKTLAIIPARGGSKRIPRKNIKPFLGKPIISYSIQSALACGLFDEVMVSTDDREIAGIASDLGANVPFLRSDLNSNDYATTLDVIFEVLRKYEDSNIYFDNVCCIYPTAPFVTAERLKEGYDLLLGKGLTSVLTIVKFSFPIQRAISLSEDYKVSFIKEGAKNLRSQDLKSSYHDAGQFYWFNVEKLKYSKDFWTKETGAILLEEMEVQDIDSPADWEIAEFKFCYKNEHKT